MASLFLASNAVPATEAPAVQIDDGGDELWGSVDKLIDQAPGLDALIAHRLHLLAADRWTKTGRPVPQDLMNERRATGFLGLIAEIVLKKVREACDGPIILIKGPEAAGYYPDPSVRPYRDLDLLVPDAAAVQSALLAAGFVLTGDEELYRGIHHLRPVVLPEMQLLIEVHERPKWVAGLPRPAIEGLFAATVPSATGVDGILALPPAHHALVLAAHGWAHVPLRRLLDIVDVAAVAREADQDEIRTLARDWELERLWRTTETAIRALLYGGRTPMALRTWARHLGSVRERSVLESHLERISSPFWALRLGPASKQMARELAQHFRPEPGERWRVKAARSVRALRRPLSSVTDHDRAMEAHGLQAPSKEVSDGNSAPTR